MPRICYECGGEIFGSYYTMEITKPYYEDDYTGKEVFLHKKCAEKNYEKVN
ncbi:hypothetical protein ES703_44530 [subsurface metagenome]